MISFELLPCLRVKQLVTILSEKTNLKPVSAHYCLKTYYDSFDWRLYRNDLIFELNRCKNYSILNLINRKKQAILVNIPIDDVPRFANQFDDSKLRQILEPILDNRALVTCCTLECETHRFSIVDENEAVILHLVIEEFDFLNNRLTLLPVQGHEKFAKQLSASITAAPELDLYRVERSVLFDGLKLQGRRPKDYSSNLRINLTSTMRVDVACKYICHCLLKVIKANEQGLIADTDSEFLHDYRVAVRKMRVMLNQVDGILPNHIINRYKKFFAWLGQISSETRELDVYILNFEKYKQTLSFEFQHSINPLQTLILAKKTRAHKLLAKKLQLRKYLKEIAEFEDYLTSMSIFSPHIDMELTTKELANQLIYKAYKQVIKQGKAIDNNSPSEALHKLRKTCKKLRYLMELFQDLYKEQRIAKLIKQLKKLQTVLGDYQDYAVHQKQLEQFSEEMRITDTTNRTFLAIGGLIQNFEIRKDKARSHFAAQFEEFANSHNQANFHALFAKNHAKSEAIEQESN